MATINFDGPARSITIGYGGPITTVLAIDLYSRWKDWVVDGNAQFLPAFENAVGGDDLGAGVSLAGYFFLRNDIGWRIAASDFDYEIRIVGDFYPTDPAAPSFAITAGRSVQFILQRSSATNVVQSGGGGGDSASVIYDHFAAPGRALETINENVKRASLLIPATDNI